MSKVDLTVLGAGLGGLVAAALLAKKGKRVVVFVPGDEVGGAFVPVRIEGYQFPMGPTLSFGYERTGALRKLFADLGIPQGDRVLSASFQVALPDRRITVYPERSETLEELRREYPREIDKISKFYLAVEKISMRSSKSRIASFISKRCSSNALLQRYRFSHELLSFFDIQSRYFYGQGVNELSVIRLVSLINTSPLYEPLGFKKIADQLLEVILKCGGVVRFNESFPDIVPQRGKRAALLTTNGLMESRAVLLNTRGSLRGGVTCIGIKDQGVPVGMRYGILCLPDYMRSDDLFSLSLSRQGDENAAPQGKRALTVWFPYQNPNRDWPGGLNDPLQEIIPFIDRFSEMMRTQTSQRTQFTTPTGMFVGSEGTSSMRLERGPSKNIYLIKDDVCQSLQAVAAAEQMAKI